MNKRTILSTIAAASLALALAACGPAPASTDTATPEATTSSAPAKSAKPKPAAPKLTKAQENAKEAAESYLDLSGFSKKGLIKQLKFEGYKAADIDAALKTIKVNWKAEAAESAQAYLDTGSFSRASLIKQLKFEGFTDAEAKYGADKAGL